MAKITTSWPGILTCSLCYIQNNNTIYKMKLDKIKVIYTDSILNESEMKNIIAGKTDGASDVDCEPTRDESTCHGICYSHIKQGSCEMEYMPYLGYYLCSCQIWN